MIGRLLLFLKSISSYKINQKQRKRFQRGKGLILLNAINREGRHFCGNHVLCLFLPNIFPEPMIAVENSQIILRISILVIVAFFFFSSKEFKFRLLKMFVGKNYFVNITNSSSSVFELEISLSWTSLFIIPVVNCFRTQLSVNYRGKI